MKKLLTKKSNCIKIMTISAMALIALLASPYIAFAENITLNLPDAGDGIVGEILRFIFDWMWVLGLALTGFGAVSLAISITNQDAQSKTSAIKWLIAGAIIVAIGIAFVAIF